MDPGHHDQITSLLTDCTLDHIFDVRSEYYYENWRILGGEHHPFTGNGLHGFDPSRIVSENITSVAFYCWTQPWQSEPAAIWFANEYPEITVYDLKGLSFLDDIPGFCQFIDGDQAFIDQMSQMDNGPQCLASETGTHQCAPDTPEAIAHALDPVIAPDFTETAAADQAGGQVTAEMRQAEADFNAAHNPDVKPPLPERETASEVAVAADAAEVESEPLPLVIAAVVAIVVAVVAMVSMATRGSLLPSSATPEEAGKGEDSAGKGQADDLEVEIVESPLEATVVAECTNEL